MIWSVLFAIIWATGSLYHWGRRHYIRTTQPWNWNRRMHGLISISDRQMNWIIALWPIVLLVGVVSLIVLSVFELCLILAEKLINYLKQEGQP